MLSEQYDVFAENPELMEALQKLERAARQALARTATRDELSMAYRELTKSYSELEEVEARIRSQISEK